MNKIALLIGINYYGQSNKLYGCINDIIYIKNKLLWYGYLNWNIIEMQDGTWTQWNLMPTKKNI